MKLKNIFFAVLVAAIAFFSCDKISNPIFSKQANSTLPNRTPDYTDSSTTYTEYKMLLEVCGGHSCTNCPLGEADAEGVVKSPIGGQVVFMQDEEGPEADTITYQGYPDSAFRKVYQCMADSTWYYRFGPPDKFPWGMVNREGAPNNTFVLYANYQDSASAIITTRNTQPVVTINIHDSCWTNPRIIGAEFQVKSLKSLSGYSLETLIVEDSIYDWQDDNSKYELYWHRNILRGAFGGSDGAWGIQIPNTTAGSTFTSYQTYDFTKGENGKAKGWNMAHCYIVAFVFNTTTYEVVQAEMIKIE